MIKILISPILKQDLNKMGLHHRIPNSEPFQISIFNFHGNNESGLSNQYSWWSAEKSGK